MTKIKSFSTSIGAKPMATKAAEKEEPDKKTEAKADAAEKGKEKVEETLSEKKDTPAPKVMKPVMTSVGIKTTGIKTKK